MERAVLAAEVAPAARLRRIVDWSLVAGAAVAAGCAVAADSVRGTADPLAPVLAAVFAGLGAAAVILAGLDRVGREGPRRNGIAMVSISWAIILIGQAVGYLLTATESGPFEGRIEAIPLALGAPFGAVGLYLLVWPRGIPRRDLWGIGLDSIIGLTALTALWVEFISPRWAEGVTEAEQLWYLVDRGLLLTGAGVIIVLSAASRRAGTLPLIQVSLLLGATAVYVTGDILGEIVATGDRRTGITYSILAYVGAIALAVAFCHRPALEAESPRSRGIRDGLAVGIPLLVALLAGLMVIQHAARFGLSTLTSVAVTIAWTLLLVSVLVARIASGRELREVQDESFDALVRGRTRRAWFDALLERSTEFLVVLDAQARVIFLSPSARARLPFSGDGESQPLATVVADWTALELQQMLAREATPGNATDTYDLQLIQRDGSRCEVEATVSLARDVEFECFVLLARDVTVTRRLATELETARRRDDLTGLLTWGAMADEVTDALVAAQTDDRVAFVALDISNFGTWNETLGREGGDETLKAVATTFETLPAAVKCVARLGSDSFGWLILGPDASQLVAACLRTTSDRLAGLILPSDREVNLSFRAGYTVHRASRDLSAKLLMEEADVALSRAKISVGAQLVEFRPGMNEDMMRRLSAEVELREALAESRLEVWYQPVMSLADGSVVGTEALVRMRRRDGTVAYPDAFIPVAEEVGLICELGTFVREQAIKDTVSLERDLGIALTVAVNVSAREFEDRLAVGIARLLADQGLPPERLVVEVTESAIHEHLEASARVLERLRHDGVAVAIDDFGTGYSSLAALIDLPVDILKIDKSFVMDMVKLEASAALVATVVRLAEALSMAIVAEGVETEEIAGALRRLRCQQAQGYLFAKPMPLDQLRAWLIAHPRPREVRAQDTGGLAKSRALP